MTMDEKLGRAAAELPAHIGAGLSGGADSVALLLALAQRGKPGLFAIHVNHGLRGETADRDEAFCRDLCSRLGIPLKVYRLALPRDCGEEEARTARYAAFQTACEEEECDSVALAHHRDDQAETFLLRLLRGSGTRGLGGLRAETRLGELRVFRPLLGFTHRELCGWLTAKGQAWVEDETNGEPMYLRNRVRHELLPLMERLAPGAAERIAQTALLLQKDEDALTDGWADEWVRRNSGDLWLRLDCLEKMPDAVTARVLRLWWERSPANRAPERSLSAEQTDALMALLHADPGRRRNLPSGWRTKRGERFLHLLPPEGEERILSSPADGLRVRGLKLRINPDHGEPADGKRSMRLPRSVLDRCCVRSARPGDRITPVHSGHSRPLREYFRDRGVEPPFRRWIPLLCDGPDVLMAPGLGQGELPEAAADEEILWVEWTGNMPWTEA